jgi:hypothetical protein
MKKTLNIYRAELAGGTTRKIERLFTSIVDRLEYAHAEMGDLFEHLEELAKLAIEASPDYDSDIRRSMGEIQDDLDREYQDLTQMVRNVKSVEDLWGGRFGEMTDI